MADIAILTKLINKFVRDRNWEKFQTPKDLAISVCLEAAELLEHFQWKGPKQYKKHIKENKDEVSSEIADVAIYLFKLSDKLNIDLGQAIEKKIKKASKKFPVNKVKGDSRLETYYKIKKEYRAKSK